MNPVAGRISSNQAGPRRYDPSPIRLGGADPCDNAYLEYEHPEVIVQSKHGSKDQKLAQGSFS